MRRVITFARFAASVGALVALIIAGGKLADHNYNIIVESWVIVENLGWKNLGDNLPERYKNYPYFNF